MKASATIQQTMMEGSRFILIVVLVALALVGAIVPLSAQEQEEPGIDEDDPSFWQREFAGLQLKTWIVIVLLVVAVFVVLEGLGWLLLLGGIGYVLWLLLR